MKVKMGSRLKNRHACWMQWLRSARSVSCAYLTLPFALGCSAAEHKPSSPHDAALPDSAVNVADAAVPTMDSSVVPLDAAILHTHDATTDAAGPPSDAAPAVYSDAAGPCSTQRRDDPLETWIHADVGTTIQFKNEPPSSGTHYPVWARWQIHADPLPRPYWVHNLEHGGIVLLYGPHATSEDIADLEAVYGSLPLDPKCTHARALMTKDLELSVPIAVVAAGHVLLADCVDSARIIDFTRVYRDMAPESVCSDGSYP